ncbi:MAG: hypothetical protein H6853_07360 [Rhodospirillales bacterium]|nr:hypothetical protein [Alphaproteobacteria bacterium]USO03345.1 MAG: hypothetical protein H6853_07360 [Rhodospirillales bacterium]
MGNQNKKSDLWKRLRRTVAISVLAALGPFGAAIAADKEIAQEDRMAKMKGQLSDLSGQVADLKKNIANFVKVAGSPYSSAPAPSEATDYVYVLPASNLSDPRMGEISSKRAVEILAKNPEALVFSKTFYGSGNRIKAEMALEPEITRPDLLTKIARPDAIVEELTKLDEIAEKEGVDLDHGQGMRAFLGSRKCYALSLKSSGNRWKVDQASMQCNAAMEGLKTGKYYITSDFGQASGVESDVFYAMNEAEVRAASHEMEGRGRGKIPESEARSAFQQALEGNGFNPGQKYSGAVVSYLFKGPGR